MPKDIDTQGEKFDPVPNFKYGAWRQRPQPSSDDEKPLEAYVQGAHRFKYLHYRPSEGKSKLEDNIQMSDIKEPSPVHVREYVPMKSSSIGIQTDYRESESQTEPWDPPYNLRPEAPELEVLTLKCLKYGSDLPVDEDGIAEIAEARVKQQFEDLLPQRLESCEDLKKFHDMIVEQKVREVEFMKSKLKKHYEKQMALRKAALNQEIKLRNERKEKILNRLWSKTKDEQTDKISKLREQFSRKMQRLEENRTSVANKHKMLTDHFDLDLLKSAGDPGAAAAVRGHGENFSEPQYGDFYLDTAKGLSELERWLWEEQQTVMEPEIFLPKKDPRPTRLQRIMDQTQKELSEMRAKRRLVMVKAERMRAIEKTKPRAPMQAVKPVPLEVLERNHTAIILQRTLVGRAVQKQVVETYSNHIGLIDEIRKTYGVLENEQTLIDENKKEKIKQHLELKAKRQERFIQEEIISRFEGKTISEVLNVMGRAVDRNEQWKQVDNLVLKAKDERRRREAVEGGLRQKEIHMKNILDAVVEKARKDQNDVIEELLSKTFTEHNEGRKDLCIKNDSGSVMREILRKTVLEEENEIEKASRDCIEKLTQTISLQDKMEEKDEDA